MGLGGLALRMLVPVVFVLLVPLVARSRLLAVEAQAVLADHDNIIEELIALLETAAVAGRGGRSGGGGLAHGRMIPHFRRKSTHKERNKHPAPSGPGVAKG